MLVMKARTLLLVPLSVFIVVTMSKLILPPSRRAGRVMKIIQRVRPNLRYDQCYEDKLTATFTLKMLSEQNRMLQDKS
jgi:hypothetical protein